MKTNKTNSKHKSKRSKRSNLSRRNPMTLSDENVRRWAYLNIPKFKLHDYHAIGEAFTNYFKVNNDLNMWLANLSPYFIVWNTINNKRGLDEKSRKYWWRFYLIEHPELIGYTI